MDTSTTRTKSTGKHAKKGTRKTKSGAPVIVERTFQVPAETLWKMWTTKEGLETWWGPEGFESAVRQLDVKVGGSFEISMTAMLPEIIEHLEASGVGRTSAAKGRYTEIIRDQRLVYMNVVDFIPGVARYETATTVSLSPTRTGGTRLVVVNDALHDPQWTRMAKMGWESQLGKLAAALR